MIHELAVSNFLSIREECVLDLGIPGTAPDLGCFRPSAARPSRRLPSTVVLMGPNGSGKTTLLMALVRLLQIAAARLGNSAAIQQVLPFMCDDSMGVPTRFSLALEEDWLAPEEPAQLFRYELEVDHGVGDDFDRLAGRQVSIRSEKLYHFPKGRPRRLLDRGAKTRPIHVGPEFGLKPQDDRLKAVRADASAISTLSEFNVALAGRIAERFKTYLHMTNLDDRGELDVAALHGMAEVAPRLVERVGRDIQLADLGIRSMETRDGAPGATFWFAHEGVDRSIPLGLESHGTQNLFHRLPQINLALDAGGLAVFDDVDAALHVDIASELLRWFRSKDRNPDDAQLLVTAHNVGLLDDMQKEELFIVEKDATGATRVHGAKDVQGLRRDARLYGKYRAGVVGGIPRLG